MGITGPSQQALRAVEDKRVERKPYKPRATIPKAPASGSTKPKTATGLAQQRIDQIQRPTLSAAGNGKRNNNLTEMAPCKGATEPKNHPSTTEAGKDDRRQSPQPGTSRQPEETRQASPGQKPSKAQLIKLSYGLSGAGVKRYWKYINEGLPAAVARRKAGEKAKPPTGMTGTQVDSQSGRPKQRQPEGRLEKPKNKLGRRELAQRATKGQNYARALKSVKMAVFAASSPNEMLTGSQLSELQDAIIDEAIAGAGIKAKFESIQFRPGMLIIECTNEETAAWLKRAAPEMV